MLKSIISEGKTTNEAIENGLKKLNVSKNMVEIKVLENEDKRSFFNILAPRVVKVELTLKEKNIENKIENNINNIVDEEELEKAKIRVEEFLNNFLNNVSENNLEYTINIIDGIIDINIFGKDAGFLIGHRGDVLNSLQTIVSSIANKSNNKKIKVVLDVEHYRNKRKETLENLAIKVSKTVLKTGKSITLEPMGAYERKIIHTKLQNNKHISTNSIGEEPNRRIVISKI